MGYLKYMKEAFQDQKVAVQAMRDRMIQWRKEGATERIDRPTRIDRARTLGYKPKQGVLVVRQRVERAGKMREKFAKGRRSKHRRRKKVLQQSYQVICESRANRKFPNCEVVGSYLVGKDGTHYWYEVILADRLAPTVLADPQLSAVVARHDRVGRGLTMAARKSRGQLGKGRNYVKARPSRKGAVRRQNRSQ